MNRVRMSHASLATLAIAASAGLATANPATTATQIEHAPPITNAEADAITLAPWEELSLPAGINIISLGLIVSSRSTFFIDTEGSNFDTELGLWAPNGDLLADNDDIAGAANRQSRVTATGLNSGSHFLSISGFDTVFADVLSATVEPDSRSGNWLLNMAGFNVTQGAVVPGEVDFLAFEVKSEPGGEATFADFSSLETITVLADGMDAGVGGFLDTEIALFDEQGLLIASNDDLAPFNLDSGLTLSQLDPGDYTLVVNGFDTEYADGFTSISTVTSDSGPFLLSLGQLDSFVGLIDVPGDTDYYEFTVEAPTELGEIAETVQSLDINTLGSTFDTHIALFSENGDLLVQSDDDNGQITSRISMMANELPAGTYHVAVGGSSTVFGNGFVAEVDGDEASGDFDLNTSPGAASAGSLGYAGDVDWFTFSVGAVTDLGVVGGSSELVEINTFGGSDPDGTDFDTEIAVWDEAGALIESNDDANIFTGLSRIRRVYAPGVYYLMVTGFNVSFLSDFRSLGSADTGAYAGEVATAGGPTFYSGTTSSSDRYDFFRFEIEFQPCNPADLATPSGVLDIADVVAFLQAFGNGDPAADLGAPISVLDIADVVAFLQIFGAGCPD